MEGEREGLALRTEFIKALSQVPTENWGYFFPCMIAIWRFLYSERPGLLGLLDAEYAGEPLLRGESARWFMNEIMDDSEVVDLLEQLMYPLCRDLSGRGLFRRGLIRPEDLQTLDQSVLTRLVDAVVKKADAAGRG